MLSLSNEARRDWMAMPTRCLVDSSPLTGDTSPPHLQTPVASSFAFKWNVHRRYKLLNVTCAVTKTLFRKKLADSCRVLVISLLDQNGSHIAASNLWPKETSGQGDRPQGSYEEDGDVGPRMDGALGSPGNPETPLLPTSLAFLLPSQALPSQSHTGGSVACSLTPSPRLCPTWLDESGAGTERTEALEPDCSGLDSWLPPFLFTLRMSPCLSGPPGPYL